MACGGMNGYLCLCSGDPCPPIFRSPVKGMEDIMDNQVICSIYKLPDAHKHITRPPRGVTFPNKTLTASDLKLPPVLWHEDTGRRPIGNGRQNPPGSVSGKQLGDAAHWLVINSLQINRGHYSGDSRPAPLLSHNTSANGVPYANDGHHFVDHRAGDRVDYQVGHSQGCSPRASLDDDRRQWYASTASAHYYERSLLSQFERDHYNRSHYPDNGSSHPDARGRVPAYDYPNPQCGGYPYPANRPVPQPITHGPYAHPQAAFNVNYGGYQVYGAQQWEQHYVAERVLPPPSQYPTGRLDGHHQQTTNRCAFLGRASNQRPPPPPPGFGR